MSVPVSEFIYTELENSFQIALRKVIDDIAKTLGQSPDPLRAAMNKRTKIHLVEDLASTLSQQCTYKCIHADTPAFLSTCGEPILWTHVQQKVQRCPKHLGLSAESEPALTLTPLKGGYAYAADGTVYNGQGEPCGFYENMVLTLFEVKA